MDMSGMSMGGMDMGGMDMSGMDMGGMMMAPGPSPMMAPSPSPLGSMSMNHGSMTASEMSGQESMVMYMQMWFMATTNVTLWFKEWTTDSKGKYAASVIGLMVLCLAQEALVWLRLNVARSAAGARRTRLTDIETGAGTHPDRSAMLTIARFGNPLVLRVTLSFLYGLNVFTSYMLMLAVMTFNVGYFLVIVLGLMFGHFVFMRIEQPSSEERYDSCCPSACCVNQSESEDPAPKLTSPV